MSGEHPFIAMTRALLASLKGTDVTDAEWVSGDYRLKLSRRWHGRPTDAERGEQLAVTPVDPVVPPERGGTRIEDVAVASPVYGIFYAGTEPGAPPLVSVGTEVQVGAALCVVEAMKVFTTIEAPCAGTVTFVWPRDGTEVAAGDVLVRIAGSAEP